MYLSAPNSGFTGTKDNAGRVSIFNDLNRSCDEYHQLFIYKWCCADEVDSSNYAGDRVCDTPTIKLLAIERTWLGIPLTTAWSAKRVCNRQLCKVSVWHLPCRGGKRSKFSNLI